MTDIDPFAAMVLGSCWDPPHVLCDVRPIYAAIVTLSCIRI